MVLLIPMSRVSRVLSLACFAPGLIASHLPRALDAPTVTVKNGTYVGFNDPILHTDNFYGVAYAQPPLGDLRFRPPQPLNSTWSGDRVVVDYPKECITTGKLTYLLSSSLSFVTSTHLRRKREY